MQKPNLQLVCILSVAVVIMWSGCNDSDFLSSSESGSADRNDWPSAQGPSSVNKGDDIVVNGPENPGPGGIFTKVGFATKNCETLAQAGLSGVTNFTPNMIPDGDFEQGIEGIESDYRYNDLSTCVDRNSLLPTIGEYSIVRNPNRCHRAWDALNDSQIAIFNGATGSRFWCRTFNVLPNTTYAFAVQERLLHASDEETGLNGASPLRWAIDDVDVITPSSPSQQWRIRGAVWNSESKSSVTLCGKNLNANNSGNDWAIDNICLVPQQTDN